MTHQALADFFMPTERKQGEDLFEKDAVFISSSSDTQAQAYVKASGAPRVSFTAEDIASLGFHAQCNCSRAKKGRLCKHIWATVLKLEANGSDFLACKSQIEMGEPEPDSDAVLAAKARQAEYKQRLKDQNKERREKSRQDKKQAQAPAVPEHPYDVEAALRFFSVNGFELSAPLQVKALAVARKTLAHVFHPDKGGTHEEILTLNRHHDVIAAYIGH